MPGEDPYLEEASKLFGVPLAEVTAEQRKIAKFSLYYRWATAGTTPAEVLAPELSELSRLEGKTVSVTRVIRLEGEFEDVMATLGRSFAPGTMERGRLKFTVLCGKIEEVKS